MTRREGAGRGGRGGAGRERAQGGLLPFAREVLDTPVTAELGDSFLAYSLSVITSRAIPDVRDGLKPVQRRILHAMNQLRLRPDQPHRKCAGVVGETMGKYHPHGDSAIYDALVRMGQDFGRNITFVDPRGNFGSLDDPPAAYRYTECRLSAAALEMLDEIDENTIDVRPTFDGERNEPIVLPGRLPNLLVNGTSGIAVGMATNMAPHNLNEVFEVVRLVMTKRRPVPTIEELMAVLPGPDFPSGGTVIDEGLAEAYATGRGSFRIRATARIERITAKRMGIVITELPYLVGPERVVARITELMADGRLPGVADVKNLSDRHSGLNIVVECRTGVEPRAVLTELYRMTPLEESFGINNVVLVDGVPTTLGVLDLARHYIEHRLEVIRRRTAYRLERAQERLHLLEGRIIALDAIDLVVSIIRNSADTPEARASLMEQLSLSEIQANDILEMPLRRLTALARFELEQEVGGLRRDIAEFERILGSEQRQRTIVLKELEELVRAFGQPRRTRIVTPDQLDDVDPSLAVPGAPGADPNVSEEPCYVTVSQSGLIAREPIAGERKGSFGRHDVLSFRVATTTFSTVWAITNRGRVFNAVVGPLPEVTGRSRGVPLTDVFALDKGERLRALVTAPPATGDEPAPLMLVTAAGVTKRIAVSEVIGTTAGRLCMTLKPGDTIVNVFPAPDGSEVVVISSNAQALRLEAAAVSIQGRGAGGVAGMRLAEGATVVAAGPATEGNIILTVTDGQTAKVTDVDEIPVKGRNTGGVRVTRFKTEKRVEWGYVGPTEGLLIVAGSEENPTKPDAAPDSLTLPHTVRDGASRSTRRRWLDIGLGRW